MDVKVAARATQTVIGNMQPYGKWPNEGPCSRPHVVRMLLEIELGEVTGEKAHRWLGWAQCAVVAAGAGTLGDMKAINNAA